MNDVPLVDVSHVSVCYPNGQLALDDVSVSLSSGLVCGLVGANGAGKSTLFKTLLGFVRPQSGYVMIGGQSVGLALKSGRVAYVPQTENVDWDFPVLVKDVVLMGRYGHMGFWRLPRRRDFEAVDYALQRVGLEDMAYRQIGELSGGQKKRVFVARALAQGGDVLLLDEPFAGVDIATENTLIELFRSLVHEGRLILVSTHNLGSVPHFCDEVILLKQRVIAQGAVERTFTEDNLACAFGSMLRQHALIGQDMHDDDDMRGLTVLTDDERPLVFYGEAGGQKIVRVRDGLSDDQQGQENGL